MLYRKQGHDSNMRRTQRYPGRSKPLNYLAKFLRCHVSYQYPFLPKAT